MEPKKKSVRLLVLAVLLAVVCIGATATGALRWDTLLAVLDISFSKLLRLVLMTLTVLLLTELIGILITLRPPKSHRGRTLVTLTNSLLRYAAALIILYLALTILGVDVATIVASMGVLALIIGFGAESLIADMVTGMFMLFENQCNVGDIVEVNGFRGTVQEIGLRTTSLVDGGGNIKIINNADMKNILNRSDRGSFAVCDVGIPYETDLPALEARLPEVLGSIFENEKEIMLSAPRYLGVQTLADSAVVLRFVAEVREESIFSAQRRLNRDILLGLRRVGVECPFPQVDVHNK